MSPKVWEEYGLRFEFSARDRVHHPHDPHVNVRKKEGRRPCEVLTAATRTSMEQGPVEDGNE